MATVEQLQQGAKAILQAVIDTARDEARRREQELGRKLTEAEARQLAEMVERQFRLALIMARR